MIRLFLIPGLVLFGQSEIAASDTPLLDPLFEQLQDEWSKPGGAEFVHRGQWAVAGSSRKNVSSSEAADLIRFVKQNKSRFSRTPLQVWASDSAAGYAQWAEYRDLNGDGIKDIIFQQTAGSASCSSYQVYLSNGHEFDTLSGKDLSGEKYVQSDSFCSYMPNAFWPIKVEGVEYWVFLYGLPDKGRLQLFDFRKTAQEALIESIDYVGAPAEIGILDITSPEYRCDRTLCNYSRDLAQPILRENFTKGSGLYKTPYEEPDQGSETSTAKTPELEAAVLKQWAKGRFWRHNEYSQVDLALFGDDGPVDAVKVSTTEPYEKYDTVFVQQKKDGEWEILGGGGYQGPMSKNNNATYLNGSYGLRHRLQVMEFEGKSYLLKFGEFRMGWRSFCCGVSVYDVAGNEIEAVVEMELTPSVSYDIKRVNINDE